MTLQTRLTSAFLAIVLGPLLLGAVFAGYAVTSLSSGRSHDRLAVAGSTATTAVVSLCQRARAAAQIVATGALAPTGELRHGPPVLRDVVSARFADAVRIEDASGRSLGDAGDAPVGAVWGDCSHKPSAPATGPLPARPTVSAVVEIRRRGGDLVGRARAAFVVNPELALQLADATGVDVTIVEGTRVVATTLRPSALAAAVAEASRTSATRVLPEGRSPLDLRTVMPAADQPLRVALTTSGADLTKLYVLLVLTVVIATLLAVLVAWRLARATTLPLAELADASERVAAGDLDARVPVRSRDELGRLASTFNLMTRETQAYVTALTASRDQLRGNLAVLGDTLSSTHNLDRILEVILETVMAATGAQAGAVLLVESGARSWPGLLTARSSRGLEGRGVDLAAFRVRIGDGVVGDVAARGEPRRGRIDAARSELAIGEPRCRTYIAVPFSGTGQAGSDAAGLPASGRLLGVLVLYDRLGADDFDDGDLGMLRTFAGQAAVAVENVLLHDEAERLSLTDALTGCWNARYLDVSLDREVERAARFGRPLAALSVDLDRFADVNAEHGQGAGDAVLVEVARRLTDAVREIDLVFRRRDEKFVVLLPETDQAGAEAAAERIVVALRQPIRLESGDAATGDLVWTVTASVGVAVQPLHGGSADGLLQAADDARDAAKVAGRDTWRLAGDRHSG
jgi:two-component system cell cycle response regulator